MRSLFLFLALVVLGVGALWLASGTRGAESAPAPVRPAESRPVAETSLTEILPPDVTGVRGVAVSPMENIEFPVARHLPDGSRTLGFLLKAALLTPTPGSTAILDKAELRAFGDSEAKVTYDVTAARGRARVEWTQSGPRLPEDQVVELEDATIVLHETPESLGPLTLRSARLNAEVKHGELVSVSTPETFTLEGTGLRASGHGLAGNPADGTMRILADPRFELLPGAGPSRGSAVTLKAAGAAEMNRTRSGGILVALSDRASFRREESGSGRFLEVNAASLTFLLGAAAAPGGKMQPESFDASGDVTLRTERLTGSGARAEGTLEAGEVLRDLRVEGPFRLGIGLPQGSSGLPGAGEARNVTLSGTGLLTARLLDRRAGSYAIEAAGRPVASFADAAGQAATTITADRIEGTLAAGRGAAPSEDDSFRARGDVVIESALGIVRGDAVDLTEPSVRPTLRVFGSSPVSLETREGGKGPPLRLTSRTLELRSEKSRNSLVAEGAVRGSSISASEPITFECDRLETEPGSTSALLSGSVAVSLEGRNARLRGDRLTLEEGGTGDLTGSPATVELLSKDAQSIASPHIRVGADSLTAEAPTEIRLPGSSLSSGLAAADGPMRIRGTQLTARFDANHKLSDAVLSGPITGSGSVDLSGDRLELDFATGKHCLRAQEGARATITARNAADGSIVRAASPRFDFEAGGDELALAGGGTIEIEGTRVGLGEITGRPAADAPSGFIRFDCNDTARLSSSGSARFAGGVTAESPGPAGWKLTADRLALGVDAQRQPSLLDAEGSVHLTVGTRLEARGDRLLYDRRTEWLELRGAPASLLSSLGSFRGPFLRINGRTLLLESGPGVIGVSPSASRASR